MMTKLFVIPLGIFVAVVFGGLPIAVGLGGWGDAQASTGAPDHLKSFSYSTSDGVSSRFAASAASHAGGPQGSGFLGIFQEASVEPLNISIDGLTPNSLGAGDYSYGLIAAGTHTITASNGSTTVATGRVTITAGESVTTLVYLAPNGGSGQPTIGSFENDKVAPPAGQSRVVFRNTYTVSPVDIYLNGELAVSGLKDDGISSSTVVIPSGSISIVITEPGLPITDPLYSETGNLRAGDLLNVFVVGTSASPYGLLANAIPLGAGYRLYASDGGVFDFGDAAFYGSTGAISLNKPIVGASPTAVGTGYWLVASDGGVFSFGNTYYYGSTGKIKLQQPVVGMASTPDDSGYWLMASDGGIFTFGDAGFYGSTGNKKLNKPIVGMAATPDGNGYWLVASDGGIFSFGDAGFYGSTGNIKLNKPIVTMIPTVDGNGYWLVASDGGVFSFGDAGFYGSTGNITLNKPIVAGFGTPDSLGYSLVASDGGVFSFGDAGFYGSAGNIKLNKPIVTATPSGAALPS
jgi:hypothetical protein